MITDNEAQVLTRLLAQELGPVIKDTISETLRAEAKQAGKEGAIELFTSFGLDASTPEGIREFHERWGFLAIMQKTTNRIGVVVVSVVVTALLGICGVIWKRGLMS